MQPDQAPDQAVTVEAYLRAWLDTQRSQLQPTTVKSYAGNVDRYLEPHLGDVPLDELEVAQLERLWAMLQSRGGKDGAPLSPRTVEHAAATLRSALSDAVRTGMLNRNVAGLTRLPTVDPGADDTDDGTAKVWTVEQARRFLDLIRVDRLHDVWVLALGTGMLRGEVLGLRWQDVDLQNRTLHVRRALQVVDRTVHLKPTKNSRSRTIRIDVKVAETLDRRRRLQQVHREEVGDGWDDPWGLVFTDEDGGNLAPKSVSAAFRALVLKLDVPTIRLNDLRHTHATLMLQAGAPVNLVSERLGHSSVDLTLDVYAHALPPMETEAIERFTAHLYGADAT